MDGPQRAGTKVRSTSLKMTRSHVAKISVAALSVMALSLASLPASAAAKSETPEEMVDNFAAIADDALLDVLVLAPVSEQSAARRTASADDAPAATPLGANSVVLASVDGTLATLVTSVAEESVATDASFTLDLPAGATVSVSGNGAVATVTDVDGASLGSTAVLWAKDATGQEIPTRLTAEGDVLTQQIDVQSVGDVQYPVVAAAVASRGWYSSAWVTSQGRDYVVHAVPTLAGKIANGVATLSSHTSELKAMLGSNASKVTGTIENQFHCHVVFWPGMSAGNTAYDMESWRPNVSYLVAWASGCNP